MASKLGQPYKGYIETAHKYLPPKVSEYLFTLLPPLYISLGPIMIVDILLDDIIVERVIIVAIIFLNCYFIRRQLSSNAFISQLQFIQMF